MTRTKASNIPDTVTTCVAGSQTIDNVKNGKQMVAVTEDGNCRMTFSELEIKKCFDSAQVVIGRAAEESMVTAETKAAMESLDQRSIYSESEFSIASVSNRGDPPIKR